MPEFLTNNTAKVVAAAVGAVATAVHTLTPQHTKAHKAASWLIKLAGGFLGGGVLGG